MEQVNNEDSVDRKTGQSYGTAIGTFKLWCLETVCEALVILILTFCVVLTLGEGEDPNISVGISIAYSLFALCLRIPFKIMFDTPMRIFISKILGYKTIHSFLTIIVLYSAFIVLYEAFQTTHQFKIQYVSLTVMTLPTLLAALAAVFTIQRIKGETFESRLDKNFVPRKKPS